MLKEIKISNYKSIQNDTISLGRINVFIGENGCGKSNILEALMFASIAETYDTVDSDLLNSNGIRVCKPSLMFSSFKGKSQKKLIDINLQFSDVNIKCDLMPDNMDSILSKWQKINDFSNILMKNDDLLEKMMNEFFLEKSQSKLDDPKLYNKALIAMKSDSHFKSDLMSRFKDALIEESKKSKSEDLNNFIIYTLNTEALRGIPEFLISRKGIYGETLDLIISELNKDELNELKEYLYTISWLDDFFIDSNDNLKQKGYKLNYSKSLLYFQDKFMSKKNNVFSSENSNEGVLHVLFYLANVISSKMPRLFAIDNIETSLNPHLCQHVMTKICELAKEHEKQILITTHNPAILDGLNLFDDDIRLFEVFRTEIGETKTRRIKLKPNTDGEKFKLSELWTRGFLGAISEKF